METQPNRETDQAINYILAMDFNQIINKLVKHMGWSQKHALEICDMYRKFLILHKKYGKEYTLPPSEDIDEFWHMHILDTKRYKKDCDIIFGYYLEHYPYLGIDKTTNFSDLEQAFACTQELYNKEFNEPLVEVRGTRAKILSFCRFLFAKRPAPANSIIIKSLSEKR